MKKEHENTSHEEHIEEEVEPNHDDVHDDIEIEPTEYEDVSTKDKLKSKKDELKEAQAKAQEYLTGWQKERADFANYKAEEEKKRKDRLQAMKLNLISDFFPVLDSFDMAFSNKEAWEKVDSAWRTGVEYIHSQFMKVLADYNISVIDTQGIEFNPIHHDPVEHIAVDSEKADNTVIKIIQKGYMSGDIVLRPAKVNVGVFNNKKESEDTDPDNS